jgi:hypothetical protein
MRKTFLILMSLVANASAAAEWVRVGVNGSTTSYADPATVRKAGNTATMSDLLDFTTAQSRPYGTPYLSQVTQQEYDCTDRRARTIDLRRYSENMAKGENTESESEPGQ